MKTLVVALEFPPIIGGGGSYVSTLCNSLADNQCSVRLVTSGTSESSLKPSQYLEINRYPLLLDLYNNHGDIFAAVNLIIEQIKNFTPDVIHSNHSLETLIVDIANRNFGLPHIATHHKTPEYKDELAKINGKWSMHNYVNNIKSIFFVAPSNCFKRNLLHTGVSLDKIQVIYPGIDEKIFNNSKSQEIDLEVGSKEILILIPTFPRKRKGIDFAISSLSRLHIPNKTIKVLITGLAGKNPQNSDLIMNIRTRLSPHILVDLPHPIDYTQMPTLYRMATVTLLTSEAEGLGMCLLESMASGCPVIGTDVMGINEVITNEENGLLVKYGDEQGIRNSIERVTTDMAFRGKIIEGGYQTTKTKFNSQKQAIAHIKLYAHLQDGIKQSAGGLLFNFRNQTLSVYLAKHSEFGYVIPKGNKERGETWLEAASREVREETGYSVTNPSFFLDDLSYSFIKGGETINKLVKIFGFEITDPDNVDHLSTESGERILTGQWFKIEEAISMVAHESESKLIQQLSLYVTHQ